MEIRIHKHRRGSEAFTFFAGEQPEETESEYGLNSSRGGGESAGMGAIAVLPTQLGADLQRPMDLGDNIGKQIGVLRLPPSEKGNTSTFEQGEGTGSILGARKDGSQTSNRACRRQLTSNICQSNVHGNKGKWLLETGDKISTF